jgi:hypothetical protein
LRWGGAACFFGATPTFRRIPDLVSRTAFDAVGVWMSWASWAHRIASSRCSIVETLRPRSASSVTYPATSSGLDGGGATSISDPLEADAPAGF